MGVHSVTSIPLHYHPVPGVDGQLAGPTQSSNPHVSPLRLAVFDPTERVYVQPKSQHSHLQPTGLPHVPLTYTSHQLKDVPMFSGTSSDRNSHKVKDWVRDLRYLMEAKGFRPQYIKFQEVVRHTRGRARDVILNLESRGGNITAEAAILELLEEFGEGSTATTPIATFFSRVQRPEETSTDYAIALEALLRQVEEVNKRQGRQGSLDEDRDLLLTTQFMKGLHDDSVQQRLAPMQPRMMTFKSIRPELRVISEEA